MKAIRARGLAHLRSKKRPIWPWRTALGRCLGCRKGFLGNEDGIMAVIFAMLLPVFLVIAALAIDMGYAYQKRNMVQVDASASSLAGAGTLMDDGTAPPCAGRRDSAPNRRDL